MPRAALALILLCGSAHAAPEQRQPRPAEASASVAAPDPGAIRRAQEESAARDKAWDRAMRKTMSGVCRGC